MSKFEHSANKITPERTEKITQDLFWQISRTVELLLRHWYGVGAEYTNDMEELVLWMKEKYSIEVPDDAFHDVTTFGGLMDILTGLIAAK